MIPFFRGLSCPTRQDPNEKWADHLLSLVENNKAKGVVMLIVRFCMIEKELTSTIEPNRTKLQAFTETMKEI